MQRLILVAEGESLEDIFNAYEHYAIKMIIEHTKMLYTKAGRFYVTKFNPEAKAYEDYIQKTSNPFIHYTTKNQLLNMTNNVIPGLNLFEEKDYEVVKSREKGMIGIVFNPMEEDKIREVLQAA